MTNKKLARHDKLELRRIMPVIKYKKLIGMAKRIKNTIIF
jgi:hypothetical protein